MASSEVITCKLWSSVLFPDLCFCICSQYCLNQIMIIFLKHDTSVIPHEAACFTVSNSIMADVWIYEFGYITLHYLSVVCWNVVHCWKDYGQVLLKLLLFWMQSNNVWAAWNLYSIFLWWSRGSVLAFSTQVRGFKPGRSCRIFKGEKILSTPSFGGEVKLSGPMS